MYLYGCGDLVFFNESHLISLVPMPGEQKHIYFLSVEHMSWLSLFFLRKVNAELEISIGIIA